MLLEIVAAVACTVLPAISAAAAAAAGDEPVRAWVEDLVIPTYPVGDPEKNPVFYSGRTYQGAKGPMYPYPLLDKLSEAKVDRTYRAVCMENRWIKVCILPEIGGRIFSAQDRTNGYDFIYRQHVIKPSLIGMVGAWISGGIEWNVPHHHRASTFLPVDWRIVESGDGARTVWVGETELRHRMKWIVGITLRPDRSWLEATVKVFNRTPLAHSMLYFSNVAVHANESYQVIFPPGTEWGTQHAKREFVKWPIGDGSYAGVDYKGVDVSWWKNHPRPVSIFAWNDEDDWFGGYDHGRRAGIVHVADRHQVPGKKFFEFANGPEGRMWDRILTDEDGPYLELMSGAWSDNQPDYSWCQPGETKAARQVWYPVRELGTIVAANLEAAVGVDMKDGRARVAFNATSERRGAKAVIPDGGEAVIDIDPSRPWVKEFDLPAGMGFPNASLLDSDGRELVSFRPRKSRGSPKPEAVRPPPPPAEAKTAEEAYLAGLRLDQFYSPAFEPAPYYEEAIRRDPGDARANTALGLLYLKRLMPEEAEGRFRVAVERVTANHTRPKDGEPLYYLGVALRMQDKDDLAVDAFERAAWSLAWSSASSLALAELACRRHDFSAALEKAERAIAGNSQSARALALKAAVLRRLGRPAEAHAVALRVLDVVDPLDFAAWNERVLALEVLRKGEAAAKDRAELAGTMRGAAQSYLELAFQYGAAGMTKEAVDVLRRCVEGAPDKARIHPMVHYALGFFAKTETMGWYEAGSRAAPDLCFPSRFEEGEVLRAAAARVVPDPRPQYYLGNLLYDLQPEEAIAAWERSREKDPSFPTVHRNLGLAYGRQGDLVAAVASLEKAVELDPGDARALAELDAAYEAAGADLAKRLASLEGRHEAVARRDETLRREIALQLVLGKIEDANRSLESHHFHLWEGGEEEVSNPHELYVDARLLRGKARLAAGKAREALENFESALEYPERFEIGRPSRGGRDAEVRWHMGTAREALGDAAGARGEFEKAAAKGGWDKTGALRFYRGLALAKIGKEAEAAEEFDGLIRRGEEAAAEKPRVDFFAKFGAGHSDAARKARGLVLAGLGRLGKGDRDGARKDFEEALRLDPANLRARNGLADSR
jgi:tetratricopeptide (TPR) repeat protein